MKTTKKPAGPRGESLAVLILAAGEGTRMESSRPKVLHEAGGRPLIGHILRVAGALKPAAIGVAVGHRADEVVAAVQGLAKTQGLARPVVFVRQKGPGGSGAAVLEAEPFLKKFRTALVLCGDAPLLSYETLRALLRGHREQKGQVTLLTARLANPKGYGRVIRSPTGDVVKVVEEFEATPKEAAVNEVNSGAYCFETALFQAALKGLRPAGAARERYLVQALELVRAKGGRITAHAAFNGEEVLGVNSRLQLAQAERVLNRRTLERLMLSGVTVMDPGHTYVDADVEVGADTTLWPGTFLKGRTEVGRECRIGPHAWIEDTSVANGCEIRASFLYGARILEKSQVGPFAHVRAGTVAGPRARIGNFSEVKASRLGVGSKVPHLSYIGDADVGDDVNVGAGTITCNYDGKDKHRTVIGAKAFIGSNVNLIAPVTVGRGARVGAGSTITDDVPPGALALGRARQVNKERG